jgi:hypothetical protein
MVNGGFPPPSIYGFEMVDTPGLARGWPFTAINRKFTPNRINRIFSDFSPTLPQCKHLHFIDG